jgi:hypothetical protein
VEGSEAAAVAEVAPAEAEVAAEATEVG